jgi:hypothetical protein
MKAALGAIAATVISLVAPLTASADQGDTLHGGCFLLTAEQQALTNGATEGNFSGLAIAQHADATPAGASVSCWIDVNGAEAYGTRLDFRAGGASANRHVSFNANPSDTVSVCMQVWFDDGSAWTGADGTNPDCANDSDASAAGAEVGTGAANSSSGVIWTGVDVNRTVCPLLVTARQVTGGGVGGVLVIGPGGSIFLNNPISRTSTIVYTC